MKIGFIGLGVIGNSMTSNLLKEENELFIYTRTKAKAENLIAKGATYCNSPKEVAQNSQIIFTAVGFPSDVKEVYLGKNSIIEGIEAGSICIDITTSTPTLAIELAEKFQPLGVQTLDAPVSGGDVGARTGTLTIMVGGAEEAFNKVLPILKQVGKTIIRQGNSGAGQHTKMANQIALAGSMLGLVEYISYAKHVGLDPEKVFASIGKGSAGSASMDLYAERIFAGDLQPGFYVKHYLKDLTIAVEECEKHNFELPGLNLAKMLYEKLNSTSPDLGTQALIKLYN